MPRCPCPPTAARLIRATTRPRTLASPAEQAARSRARGSPEAGGCRRRKRTSHIHRRCTDLTGTLGGITSTATPLRTRPAATAALHHSILPRRPFPTPVQPLLIQCITVHLIMAFRPTSTGMHPAPSLIPTRCSNSTLTDPTYSSLRASPCRLNTHRPSLATSLQHRSMTRTKENQSPSAA